MLDAGMQCESMWPSLSSQSLLLCASGNKAGARSELEGAASTLVERCYKLGACGQTARLR